MAAEYETMSFFPGNPLHEDAIFTLLDILMKGKDKKRHGVKGKMGRRVLDIRVAEKILSQIRKATERILPLDGIRINIPEIELRSKLSSLPKQTLKQHLLYWSIGSGILLLNSPILEPSVASWMVKGSVVFCLSFLLSQNLSQKI